MTTRHNESWFVFRAPLHLRSICWHLQDIQRRKNEPRWNDYHRCSIELLEFEEVNYWEELCEIMEWSKTHILSTFPHMLGAQAGLYYHWA